jgi:hypothetical protein
MGITVFLHNGEWKDTLFNLQQQHCHAKRVQLNTFAASYLNIQGL